MAINPDKVEQLMKDLGCTGKRVTKELIESRIDCVDYQTVVLAGQKMMFCGIKMLGGFVAVGKPAVCIDPANWRDEIGKQISYDNSFSELWKLEAYHMTYEEPGGYKTRLAKEFQELNQRVEKLSHFLTTQAYLDLSEGDATDLAEQLTHMTAYRDTLASRVERL